MLRAMLLCLIGLPLFATAATTRTWPTDPGCTGTLQACISSTAVGGDTVLIASNGPIDESVAIAQPLTLKAAPGYRPVFAAGRSISAYDIPALAGTWTIQISGLTLLGGDVGVRLFGTSYTASIVLSNLDVTVTGNTYVGAGIGIDNFGSGALNFDISGNHLTMANNNGVQGIAVGAGNGGTIDGVVHDNRLLVAPGNDYSTIQFSSSGSPSHARVYSNQLIGSIAVLARNDFTVDLISNAIGCLPGSTSAALSLLSLTSGGPVFNVYNNTAVGCDTGVYIGGGLSSARLTNNLIAFNTHGVNFNSGVQAFINADHNLLFGNASSQPFFDPGPGSVNTDPRLRGAPGNLYLNAGSPAIDAGNSADLLALLGSNTLPAIDAAGSRRIKGGSATVDIGAFEFGDASFLHTIDNASPGPDSVSVIDNSNLNNDAARYAQVTANWNPDGAVGIYDNQPVGLSFDNISLLKRWYLRAENLAAFPNGARFNVFAPAKGDGDFQHVVSSGNIAGFTTQLNAAGLNNHADRILLATRDSLDPNGSLYDDTHPFAVLYFGFGGSANWFITHTDSIDMFAGGTFHLYWQQPSLTAFVHRAVPANIVGNYTLLDHPLLNGHPCARIQATQSANSGVFNAHFVGVWYTGTRWSIFNQDFATMQPNTEFHVVIDEQQVFECSDVIFANGFE